MFVWAYGLLRVRTFYKNTHVHVNFHLGVLFITVSGFLYPVRVIRPSDIGVLAKGLVLSGFPLAFGQTLFGAGLGLNKKTGQVVILTFIPVILGYCIAYYRYGETIKSVKIIGSMLILLGLLGVTNCGDQAAAETATKQTLVARSKAMGDPASSPTQMMYNVMSIS